MLTRHLAILLSTLKSNNVYYHRQSSTAQELAILHKQLLTVSGTVLCRYKYTLTVQHAISRHLGDSDAVSHSQLDTSMNYLAKLHTSYLRMFFMTSLTINLQYVTVKRPAAT